MPQYPFGSGALWAERTDVTGSGIGPVQVGVLQDCAINYDATLKELRGQLLFPDDVAIGERKITVTAKHGRIFGALFSDVVFGTTAATGAITVAQGESASVPATSTYTYTTSNAATFVLDLGVFMVTPGGSSTLLAGQKFTRVTTPTTSGQYSVNQSTGIYTFAAADASAAVKVNYAYSLTTGLKSTITNGLQGVTPTFKATFYTARSGLNNNALTWTLNACVCNKLTLPARMGDYNIPNLDFEAFADSSGNVGTISTTE
jgi:hypothetical protein